MLIEGDVEFDAIGSEIDRTFEAEVGRVAARGFIDRGDHFRGGNTDRDFEVGDFAWGQTASAGQAAGGDRSALKFEDVTHAFEVEDEEVSVGKLDAGDASCGDEPHIVPLDLADFELGDVRNWHAP